MRVLMDLSPRTQLLTAASGPECGPEDLFRLVAAQAQALAMGQAVALLAIHRKEAEGDTPVWSRAVVGAVNGWSERLPAAALAAFETGKPQLGAAPSGGCGGGGRGGGGRGGGGGRRSEAGAVWVPVLEGRRRALGVLGIGAPGLASHTGGTEDLVTRLTLLARDAVPAINRILLREALGEMGAASQAVIGISPAFQQLEEEIKRAARFGDGPVLITGERGTGKEMAALAIHALGRRRGKPFVPILASALPESLIADELFGHEKHSFTGADQARLGRFGAAEGGTVFLDEVGDLPEGVQAALMRIIDRGELTRVGRDLPLRVDVRVITASNRNLEVAMKEGRFRRDLYDRLSRAHIRVPPLRERPEDIRLLAGFFLWKHCQRLARHRWLSEDGVCGPCTFGSGIGCVSDGLFSLLCGHDWPGNIRELENVIASLVVRFPDDFLNAKRLSEVLEGSGPRTKQGGGGPVSTPDLRLSNAVRLHLERVLELAGYNQSRAARLLGIPLSTMRNKMKKLGLGPGGPTGRARAERLISGEIV